MRDGDAAGRSAETFTFSYDDDLSSRRRSRPSPSSVYHADGVVFEPRRQKQLAQLEDLGFGDMPVCMAKTQYSFSRRRRPSWARPAASSITVRKVKVSAGAGFIVALTGDHHDHAWLGEGPRRP